MGSRDGRVRGFAMFALFALAGGALDLLSKELAFSRLEENHETKIIDGCLGFILSRNPGAAFGIFGGRFNFFLAISIGAIALVAYFSWTAKPPSVRYQLALGMIAAGVLGNLHDRLRFHFVRDFIKVYVDYDPVKTLLLTHWPHTNVWPIFNVADSFICVGAGALMAKYWLDERRERREKK